MQWSPDSTRIASSVPTDSFEHSVDGVIHVWDARTGKEICSYNSGQPNDQLIDMEWSWDSKLIACVMNSAGGNARVTVWNASNGATVTTRAARSGGDNIAWHPQHYYIASTAQSITDQNNDNDDEYKVYIWDATTGKEFAQLHSNVYQALAWSPDGMQLAIGILNLDSPGTGAVQLWQIWQ
jgi:WD40 repeat protein